MNNLFFEAVTSAGRDLYFAPSWTGRDRVYQLVRPEPDVVRQAFAVDGRQVLRAALRRLPGAVRLSVSRWKGEELDSIEFACASDARFLQLALAPSSGALEATVLEEAGAGRTLHLVRWLPALAPVYRSFPSALERRTPGDAFFAGNCPELSLAFIAHRSATTLQVERLTTLEPARSSEVTKGFLHFTRELAFVRDGLDLNKPTTQTWLEIQPQPQTSPDTFRSDLPPSLLGGADWSVVVETVPLQGVVSGQQLQLHELVSSRPDDHHQLASRLLATFDLRTGEFLSGRHQGNSRKLFRFHQPFEAETVSVVQEGSVVLVDGSSAAKEPSLGARITDSIGELFGANAAERAHFLEHPFESITGFFWANVLFLKFGHGVDDEADAQRHTTWAALLTDQLGVEAAQKILANHEAEGPVDPMDVHNNKVGVFLGQHWKAMGYASISAAVSDVLAKGYLVHEHCPGGKAKWDAYLAREQAAGRTSSGANRNPQNFSDGNQMGPPQQVPQQLPQQPPQQMPQQPQQSQPQQQGGGVHIDPPA